MTKHKQAIGVAAILVAMALTPLGSADPNGDLARTFPDNGPAVYVEWKDAVGGGAGGVGWYDPFEPTNLCLVSLFGLAAGGGVGFYYESQRVYTNFNKHVFELGQDLQVPLQCPFVVPSPPDQNQIGTTNFNVDVTTKIGLSVLLCVNNAFADCELIDGTEDWDLFACKADAASGVDVVPGAVTDKPLPVSFDAGDIVGELTQLAALQGATAVGSSAIHCDRDGDGESNEFEEGPPESSDDFGHWHDATDRLDPENRLTCPFLDCPHVDEIVHVGHGDAYVISDYEAMAFDNAGFEKGGEPFAVCAHDYFLVLDRASPDQWAIDVADHLRGDNPVRGTAEGIDLKRGLFDLSTDNGCIEENTSCVLEGKAKGDALPPKPEKDSTCTEADTKKDNPDPKD